MSSSDWCMLGDIYLRKFELYSLNWPTNIDFSKSEIVGSSFGGPIAICSDLSKQSSASKPNIWICSSSGQLISSIKWNSGTLLSIGWSGSEELVCVQNDGTILIYTMFATFVRSFSMGDEAKTAHVTQSQIFQTESGTTGLAILTSLNRFYLTSDINEITPPKRLSIIPGSNLPPNCWSVINFKSPSKVLVAKESNLYFLNLAGNCILQKPSINQIVDSFLEMSLSFNNKYIALFTSSRLIWIGSSDLLTAYCECETDFITRPLQVAWCGTSGVVAIWKSTMLVVGPKGDSMQYDCEPNSSLVTEFDCCRIISQHQHQLLQKVPPEVEDIFKIASVSNASILYEAYQQYQMKSSKSEEYLRMIETEIDLAILTCIHAASQQFQQDLQKSLLRAASFGNSFLKDQKMSEFVNVCRNLRILNSLRNKNVGLPFTYKQLVLLTPRVLIDRLILRKTYWLAALISTYLKLPEREGVHRVLAHWAIQKIENSKDKDENQLGDIIAKKLNNMPGLSYVEIATRAFYANKEQLAIKLLSYEPRSSEQVQLLLKMGKDELAMQRAISSHDSDLIYLVLFEMKRKLQKEEFLMKIRTYKQAYNLFIQYCRVENRAMLIDIFEEEDDKENEADCRVYESYDQESIEKRLGLLISAGDAYFKAKNEVAFKLTAEEVALLRLQQKLERELNIQFVNKPLMETLSILINNNCGNHIEHIRKEFKLTDKRFWRCKVEALASKANWVELEQFSKSKKSPIGYEAFVSACIRHGNTAEVPKYLAKVSSELQVKFLLDAKLYNEAVDLALSSKRVEDVNLCLDRVQQPQLLQRLQTFKR